MAASSDAFRQRRNRLKRPPRGLRVAGLARWPRPVWALILVVILFVGAVVWSWLVWPAAVLWGVWAAAAVLDGALRGRQGVVAGFLAAGLGPLGGSLTALVRRRAIRKVPEGEMPWAQAYAILALIGGFAVAGLLLPTALERGPHGVSVPRAAMGDRVLAGDRVLVAPDWMLTPAVGDIVIIDAFDGVAEALGDNGPVAGAGRIIGVGGQVVGAIDGALYLCERLPDAAVGLQEEDGCVSPSEIAYLRTPTPDFGPIEIPEGSYWVLSDDREAPLVDSRIYGPVPADAIDGRVIAVVSPLSRLGLL